MRIKKAKYIVLLLFFLPVFQMLLGGVNSWKAHSGHSFAAPQSDTAGLAAQRRADSLTHSLDRDSYLREEGMIRRMEDSLYREQHDSLGEHNRLFEGTHMGTPSAPDEDDDTESLEEFVRRRTLRDSLALDSLRQHGLYRIDPYNGDTIFTLPESEPETDTTATGPVPDRKPFLDDIISGKNQDSLIYDVRNKVIYIYEKGDVTYQNMNMKGDFMRIDMDAREVFAYGRWDSTEQLVTRPEFSDGGSSFTMDTITYNLDSKKARIKGIATEDGEGFLTGARVKKMSDDIINITGGHYTTCDADHPHFYLHMTRAKAIPGKKVIIGPSYLVMEDVPIYFLGLPFGFFPTTSGRQSGFLFPSIGEEPVKGFFIREGGYYFAFNDYVDMALTGGIYTLGSWDAAIASRYLKKYRYNGGLNITFTKNIIGEKGSADYMNMNAFQVTWNHSMDPKWLPGTNFSASVNFSTSGYNKYGATNMNDYLNTQTNSSINFSKTWAGTPFSLSTSIQHSQNSRDSTVSLSFPNISFSVSRIYPFQRKNAVGKQRWYEKISFAYDMTFANSVTSKEKDLFTDQMFKSMRNGVNHSPKISTDFTLFKYFNLSPQFNYRERWYFRKIERAWDPELRQAVNSDTISGFYRLYDYSFSVGTSTKIYSTFDFGKTGAVHAIRHVITPNVSFNYTPDFGSEKFGYYKWVQSDTLGNMTRYSPFADGAYGVPGSGKSMGLGFGLSQTLEVKVRDRKDTAGFRKIKLVDQLNITSSYNFLADSMKLAPFNISFRTQLFTGVALNLNATLDPYAVDENGKRYDRFMLQDGKLGRISSASTSFGYSFNSPQGGSPKQAGNDINSPMNYNYFTHPDFWGLDPASQRAMMSSVYYDFRIPWNFGFNYSISYTNNGLNKKISQTLGFQGSVTLTDKWGINFSGGYDFEMRKLTPGTISISRDLHCWQMSLQWVPVGFRKSWSFTIGVNAASLSDLKYDRRSSFYDNLYDN